MVAGRLDFILLVCSKVKCEYLTDVTGLLHNLTSQCAFSPAQRTCVDF